MSAAIGCSSTEKARVDQVRPEFHAYREGPPLEVEARFLIPADIVTFAGRAPKVPAAIQEFSAGCNARWTVTGPAATPREATGRTVTVQFAEPGRYEIAARCDDEVRRARVEMCDFAGIISDAAGYFGDSIDFGRVRIEHGPTVSSASWVAHNKVNISTAVLDAFGGCPDATHYVHELGHVWEHQHGMSQLLRGALDQIEHALVGDVYDFGGHAGVRQALRNGTGFDDFNLEQIAEIFAADFAMKRAGIDDGYARDLAELTKGPLTAVP